MSSSAELARSVISSFTQTRPNFTSDLPVIWREAPGEDPIAEWRRYIVFLRGLDLRTAASRYDTHRDHIQLEAEIEQAYQKAEKQLKNIK